MTVAVIPAVLVDVTMDHPHKPFELTISFLCASSQSNPIACRVASSISTFHSHTFLFSCDGRGICHAAYHAVQMLLSASMLCMRYSFILTACGRACVCLSVCICPHLIFASDESFDIGVFNWSLWQQHGKTTKMKKIPHCQTFLTGAPVS